MLGALLRPLIRSLLQEADDYVSQPIPPKPDYVSPPLSSLELQQVERIHQLAEHTGDLVLLTHSINMSDAFMRADSSRVRQEMFDAVRHVKKVYRSKDETTE